MKILIIYASAGTGHRKAAEAIFDAFFKINYDGDIQIIDALDYTNFLFRQVYSKGYIFLIAHLPWLWGFFYRICDEPKLLILTRSLRHLINRLNSRRFVNYLIQTKADVILMTHFFANDLIRNLKNKGKIKSYLALVITDFGVHSFWIRKGFDKFVVALPQTKEELISRGIEASKIETLGIPVNLKFLEKKEKRKLLLNMGAIPDSFTVLIVSGGSGIGPIKRIVKLLNKEGIQQLVVCGRNSNLEKSILKMQSPKIKVFGPVSNMAALMSAADLLITKPGGLTLAEALAKRVPLILILALPGQESKNAKILESLGVAVKVKKAKELKFVLRSLKDKREKLEGMRRCADLIARPTAAIEIAKWIISMN